MAKEAERFGAREQALKVGADENAILAAQIAGNDLLVKQLKDQLALDQEIARLEKLGFLPEEATAEATKTQELRDQLALKQAAEKSAKEEAKAAEAEAKAAEKIAAEKAKAAYDEAKGAVDERASRHGRKLTPEQEARAIGHEMENKARREAQSARNSSRNEKGNFDDIFHKRKPGVPADDRPWSDGSDDQQAEPAAPPPDEPPKHPWVWGRPAQGDDPDSPDNRALDQIETDAGNNSGEGLGAAAEKLDGAAEKHTESASKLSATAEKLGTSAEEYATAAEAISTATESFQTASTSIASTMQQFKTDLETLQSQVDNLRTA